MTFKIASRKPVANVQAGRRVATDLYRVRAEVSHVSDGWKEAVEEAFDRGVSLVEGSFFDAGESAGGRILEGFCQAHPQSRRYAADGWLEAAAEDGVVLREVAANMYMDADEQVWSFRKSGDQVILTRDSGDEEVQTIVANVNAVLPQGNADIVPLVRPDEQAVVAYVTRDGFVSRGILFASVGSGERVQILDVDVDEAVVATTWQIVAADDLPHLQDTEDFDSVDPADYWRQVWSDDPDMLNGLRETMNATAVQF